jgi:predicted nucleotidyltransferase
VELKVLRKQKGLTQKDAAVLLGIPLKTYQNYELGRTKLTSLGGRMIVLTLTSYEPYAPGKGILTLGYIKDALNSVLNGYDIGFVYLFGSYAKGKATENSDVDLLISTNVDGLAFFGLAGRLEEALHNKVDLIRLKDLKDNEQLVAEIFKTGVKIYG